MKVIFNFFTRDFPVKKIIWKKFLKGFLLKIEAEGTFLKDFPCILEKMEESQIKGNLF